MIVLDVKIVFEVKREKHNLDKSMTSLLSF